MSQCYHLFLSYSKIPSVLEYFAYIFQFHVLMAGPVVFYKDYIEFIHGHNFLKHASTVDVSSNLCPSLVCNNILHSIYSC